MEEAKSACNVFDDCDQKKIRAIDDTMDVLSGKWKLSIIARLWYKPIRFSALLRDVTGISGKVLSRELKDLELNGLIHREVTQDKPPAVIYKLSEYGISLKDLTDSIADWGLKHRERIINSIK